MNIRQCRGNSLCDNPSFPYIVPVSQALFLAVGMCVPASGLAGLGVSQGAPTMPTRRDAIVAAVAAHNRCHKPLPHSAVRLLQAMFASDDGRHANRYRLLLTAGSGA
jgi:hypothetical protein